MFQSSKTRLRTWLTLLDDVLGDPEPVVVHPHRRALRWERERRPGSVPARPAVCVSPVRGAAPSRIAEREPIGR